MKALLFGSLLCAACSFTHSPAMTAQTSLQSNWNASPGANTSGTKVPRPLVCCSYRNWALPLRDLPAPLRSQLDS